MSALSIPPHAGDIIKRALNLRREYCSDENVLCIVSALDRLADDLGFVYDIVDRVASPSGEHLEARLICGGTPIIEIADPVYELAAEMHPAARFTLAHEIGHFILHRDEFATASLGRGRPGSGTSFRERPLQESEANTFAGGLLMPATAVTSHSTAAEMAALYKISLSAAEASLRRVRVVDSTKWRIDR